MDHRCTLPRHTPGRTGSYLPGSGDLTLSPPRFTSRTDPSRGQPRSGADYDSPVTTAWAPTQPAPPAPQPPAASSGSLSPFRQLLVLLVLLVSCFGMAYAATGMLTALPAPAAGGTCGPSTASETALQALADPSSIGAGPEPQAGTTAHTQWQAFVDQCQQLADRRGLASMAIFVISLAVGAMGLILLLRQRRQKKGAAASRDSSGSGAEGPLGMQPSGAPYSAMVVPPEPSPAVGIPAPPTVAPPPAPSSTPVGFTTPPATRTEDHPTVAPPVGTPVEPPAIALPPVEAPHGSSSDGGSSADGWPPTPGIDSTP